MEEAVKSPKIQEQEEAVSFPETREQEEVHLKQTYEIVKRNVQRYREDVAKMSVEVDKMIAHFHDDNPELYKVLQNTITMNDNSKRALFRNEQALKKAYFGRIDYRERGSDKREAIYIGKGGIFRDTAHIEVVDWRAPISAAYYESRTGKCHYIQPDGSRKAIDVSLKRTYEIDEDRLVDFFDSETVANDELLTKYLAKNKQAVLGEIIASIQKEQDDIIRKSPFWNVLVQGVAGSGKTTVAMHRISFILYNYPDRFKAQDFYIIGSNHILLNYITGVLPELDVYGAKQMTMEELFVRLLYEDWDAKKYRIVPVSHDGMGEGKKEYIKGTSEWFQALSAFADELEWNTINREDVILNRKQFVQGFYNGTAGVHDITATDPATKRDLVELVRREEVERYVRENPAVSMKSKIEMLNLRLENRVDTELTGKHISYTEAERKAIRKAFRSRYGKKGDKVDIYGIYRDFVASRNTEEQSLRIPQKEFDVYDLAALAFLYKRLKETDPIREASHIVIDEAQDFGMMVYHAVKYCIPGCTYTVMGDVSQNIRFGYGLTDWEELKKLILTGDRDSFGILKKSYRNTVEISEFASKILRHGSGRAYVAEPVIRHGKDVYLQECTGEDQMLQRAAEQIKEWQGKDLNTIAVVCRDTKSADRIHKKLGKLVPLQDNNLETAVFGIGAIVLPVELTKGLEFDAVLILEPDRTDYPVDIGHAKLLYVAATRALHELTVLHCHPLSGLITDPIPENSLIEEVVEESSQAIVTPGQDHDKSLIKEMIERERDEILTRAKPMLPSGKRSGVQAGTAGNPAEPSLGTQAGTTGQQRQAMGTTGTAAQRQAMGTTGMAGQKQATGFTGMAAQRQAMGTTGMAAQRQTAGVTGASQGTSGSIAGIQPQAVFGERLLPAQLKVKGHSVTDQAVRWIEKREDGLYLMSRYGVLRLCPLNESCLRVTFAKGSQIHESSVPTLDLVPDRFWLYKEKKDCIELKMDAMTVNIEKASGRLQYFSEEGKPVLSERAKESRLIEAGEDGQDKLRQYYDWSKKEELFGMLDSVMKKSFRVNGRSGYLTDYKPSAGETSVEKSNRLPWIYSQKGYIIVLLSKKKAYACDMPVYGSFLGTEGERQLDYCVILGKDKEEMIRKMHELLC